MVFLVPPFDLRRGPETTVLGFQSWNGKRPMRAVVVDRNDFSLRKVIEMPAGMVLHLGNGWNQGQSVRLDACLAPDDGNLQALSGAMRGETPHAPNTDSVLVTLDLERGTARTEVLLRNTEFPRVASADVGQRYPIVSCSSPPASPTCTSA